MKTTKMITENNHFPISWKAIGCLENMLHDMTGRSSDALQTDGRGTEIVHTSDLEVCIMTTVTEIESTSVMSRLLTHMIKTLNNKQNDVLKHVYKGSWCFAHILTANAHSGEVKEVEVMLRWGISRLSVFSLISIIFYFFLNSIEVHKICIFPWTSCNITNNIFVK